MFWVFFFSKYLQDCWRNVGLDEAQAGIMIARRNINNLRMQMTPHFWQQESLDENERGE